jgi:Transposase and inactivated derivatives
MQPQEEKEMPPTKATRPRTKYVVGMDAHTRKLAISIWEWSDPWNPRHVRNVKCFGFDDLANIYRKYVDEDSITILEASGNSALIKEMLFDLGYRAEVVRADIIANKERKRKVCDEKDSENLAKAYLKGDIEEFVWTPTGKYARYRSIFFAFRDAKKEAQRNWNRIWSLCCANGVRLPEETGAEFSAAARKAVGEFKLDEFTAERFEMLIKDYEYYLKRVEELDRMIIEIVSKEDEMINLMQLPGIYYEGAFAIVAIIEDARRFSKGSKMSAYSGLAVVVNTSGEEEVKAKKRKKGIVGKPLDTEGRRDLKFYFCEAGRATIGRCKDSKLGKWGASMLFRGKEYNKVVCAVGRKLTIYSWHVMRGDPTPNREGEELFRRKMVRFASDIGKDKIREMGFKDRNEFAQKHVSRLYANLPAQPSESKPE